MKQIPTLADLLRYWAGHSIWFFHLDEWIDKIEERLTNGRED